MAIPVRGLAPLLQVFDMPTSLAFYRDLLGFEVVEQAGPPNDIGWVLLRLGNAEVMLNTAFELPDRPPAPDPLRVSAHADTAIYLGCPDVDGAYTYLRSRNHSLQPPTIAPYGMKQLYIKDPDGYTLCFQWPAADQTRQQWEMRYGVNVAGAAGARAGADASL